MKIVAEDHDSCLTLQVTESESVYYPSLNLAVTIIEYNFCTARAASWVALNDYKAFIHALR